MTRTVQGEFATAEVPTLVWAARPRRVEGMEAGAASISEAIGSGRAFLKVVAYPWGVEYDLCTSEEGA